MFEHLPLPLLFSLDFDLLLSPLRVQEMNVVNVAEAAVEREANVCEGPTPEAQIFRQTRPNDRYMYMIE